MNEYNNSEFDEIQDIEFEQCELGESNYINEFTDFDISYDDYQKEEVLEELDPSVKIGSDIGNEIGKNIGKGIKIGKSIGCKIGEGIKVGISVGIGIGKGIGQGVFEELKNKK